MKEIMVALLTVCGFCHASEKGITKHETDRFTHSPSFTPTKSGEEYPNFTHNPAFTPKMREQVSPYLFPLHHPLKRVLDRIFSRAGVVANEQTLKKAGFSILSSQKISLIVVAKHPKVPGYLFKIYLNCRHMQRDGQKGWQLLRTRCVMAEKIRLTLGWYNIRHFTVPDKYLYPLPPSPSSPYQEPVVLLVKDMHIYNDHASIKAWRTKITKSHLKELYAVISKGYGSVCLHKNIPYTKDGTFAFIDTEYPVRDLPLGNVLKYTSKKMGSYWKRLMKSPPSSLYGCPIGSRIGIR